MREDLDTWLQMESMNTRIDRSVYDLNPNDAMERKAYCCIVERGLIDC